MAVKIMRSIGLLAVAVAVMTPAAAPGAAALGAPSPQDEQYLRTAHQSNLAEIVISEMAARHQGEAPVVVRLGDEFKTDHTKLDESLQSTARLLGVALPATATAVQQQVAGQLAHMERAGFDKAWVLAQVNAHEAAMAATQAEIDKGQDPAVVQLARDAMPIITAHHDALVQAAAEINVQLP
jgi:predicted outer membrane protein